MKHNFFLDALFKSDVRGDGDQERRRGFHGDAGGPFVFKIDGRWELHGVVSYGHQRCAETYIVHARVAYYKRWIDHIMNN